MNSYLENFFSDGTPAAGNGRIAVGIGVFDGVHLGHRKLLAELRRIAGELDARPVALTFHPHPRSILRNQEPPTLLTGIAERVRLLHEYGAESVTVIPFTHEFAALEPAAFLENAFGSGRSPETVGICVGAGWRFGAGGRGDAATVAEFARERGILFSPVPELSIDGEVVSSSVIRRAVASGMLDKAARFLGRPYELCGTVESGFNFASTSLGFPTANVRIADGVLVPDGVYAARVRAPGQTCAAAVNVGISPTFAWNGGRRRVEAHLLGFSGDLYGRELRIEFVRYLRSERAFAGEDELRRQIARDIEQIHQIIND